eukprot:gene24457-biopygen8946
MSPASIGPKVLGLYSRARSIGAGSRRHPWGRKRAAVLPGQPGQEHRGGVPPGRGPAGIHFAESAWLVLLAVTAGAVTSTNCASAPPSAMMWCEFFVLPPKGVKTFGCGSSKKNAACATKGMHHTQLGASVVEVQFLPAECKRARAAGAFGASVGRPPPPPEPNNRATWIKQPRICPWNFGRPGARARSGRANDT